MIFRKSVKQLLRTPVTTALFLALFAIAAFFVSSGAVIWARNQAAMKAYADVFVTIGTVRQQPTSIEVTSRWDAYTKEYRYGSTPNYASITPPSVLDFDGADYIIGPERRPFYGAYRPDLVLLPEVTRIIPQPIIEFTPLEDCIPEDPIVGRVVRVLSEIMPNTMWVHSLSEGGDLLICDHHNDAPEPLYAGKTYLMFADQRVHIAGDLSSALESFPIAVTFSTQHRPDGTVVEGDIVPPAIREVTEGFYETEEGRRWLEYASALSRCMRTLPVLPTNGTHLLMPFYNGTAYIAEGGDITPEEYESGERVCLVSDNFARRNGLSPGDTLRLPLSYANYRLAPAEIYVEDDENTMGRALWWPIDSPLDAEGYMYPVFSDHEYIVKGIYSTGVYYSYDAVYSMGANTVVIPAGSVRESDGNNIIDYGPMKHTTTAFQIPNGSIESFMEKWLAQGHDEIEIEFHDKGYTQLQRGLENMRRVSMLFLAIGTAMSLTLVFFFCHVFIAKNKMRTAIERMLGYTRKQCAVSLLTGFLLTAVLSVAIGCAVGVYAQGRIADMLSSQDYYDITFTIGPLGRGEIEIEATAISALYSPMAGLALIIVTALISLAFMYGNVKEEPLRLLGRGGE